MIKENTIKLAIDFLLRFPDEGMKILNSDLCMPNIPFPTMGGHVFWTNICEYQGYRLQQNEVTHHARILDSKDVRIAWGTVNGMKMTLERMADMATKYANDDSVPSKSIVDVEAELISIKKLFDQGIFTKEEFENQKEKILSQIK